MNSGISKKLIFTSFLFINFIQPAKSADLQVINKKDNNSFEAISVKKNFLERHSDLLFADLSKKKEQLIIQSDKQSEINDVIYAEGNVSVSYRGKLIKADNLIYDKSNKKISATGNIALIFGDQIFKVSKLEYSFINEKGYLLNVKGSINSNNLIDDLSKNFTPLDSSKVASLLELKKKRSFKYT